MSSTPSDPPAQGLDGAAEDKILILRPYPVRVGQKITIEAGPRGGDWEIIGVGEPLAQAALSHLPQGT
ncbi:MAG: hypothetical protein Q7O12_00220 [Deltaproteobacteria bacterium]|nr:hypothetical protein [Deltaproteobacteria bacterium]